MDESRINALALVGSTALAFFVLERIFPLRKQRLALGHRLFVNGVMSVLTYGAAAVAVQPVALWAINWTSGNSLGALHLFGGPVWLQWVVGFLMLDLTFYYWHRLNHRLPILWRFHNVHHVDPDLDVSTGFRFHFGEVALSALFRVVQVAMIGMPLFIYAAYEVVFQIGTYFHHSNIRLPKSIEVIVNFVFVTPRMHGIHHSNFHMETDSNYSVVFSFWDRLHRTYRWGIPQTQINIGVPGYAKPSDNLARELIMMPFRQQRDYWLGREQRAKIQG